ncbi:MAG: alpha/beta fold hydrolase [Pseudomonadota bacterium]
MPVFVSADTFVLVDIPERDATGDAAKAVSLEAYVETVAGAVASADDPVILVGHSFGVMTITAIADRMPEAIQRLIYVAAYVPQSGETMETRALSDQDNPFTKETFVIAGGYSHAEVLSSDQVPVFAQDARPRKHPPFKRPCCESLLRPSVRPSPCLVRG